jgi:hypothetical protein
MRHCIVIPRSDGRNYYLTIFEVVLQTTVAWNMNNVLLDIYRLHSRKTRGYFEHFRKKTRRR